MINLDLWCQCMDRKTNISVGGLAGTKRLFIQDVRENLVEEEKYYFTLTPAADMGKTQVIQVRQVAAMAVTRVAGIRSVAHHLTAIRQALADHRLTMEQNSKTHIGTNIGADNI